MQATRCVCLTIVGCGLLGLSTEASAEVIDFELFTGPSLFGPSLQTLHINTSIGVVTVTGGVILTQEANLPADQTSVYATAQFDDIIVGYANPIVITFPQPITNFFLDVYNGNTDNTNYTVADNAGHSSTTNLSDNFSGGQSLIGFAATGSIVTITAGPSTTDIAWDFSIDNVTFNAPLPPELLPEPKTPLTLGGGLILVAALMAWARRAHWLAPGSSI